MRSEAVTNTQSLPGLVPGSTSRIAPQYPPSRRRPETACGWTPAQGRGVLKFDRTSAKANAPSQNRAASAYSTVTISFIFGWILHRTSTVPG